jgi:hypothetical protein
MNKEQIHKAGWLTYLEGMGKQNKVVAKVLTEYYLEDIDFDAVQEQLFDESDVMSYKNYIKKKKIDSFLQ